MENLMVNQPLTTFSVNCYLLVTLLAKNDEVASEEAHKQFNKGAQPHLFLPDQLVLLNEHSFLAKNQTRAPKWSGPHRILCLKSYCNIEHLLWHNNNNFISHVNCLKLYFISRKVVPLLPDFPPQWKKSLMSRTFLSCSQMTLITHCQMRTEVCFPCLQRSLNVTLPLTF
jgi:hypothetical protein